MPVVAHDRAASAAPPRVELADVFARHAEAYLGTHYATSIQRKVVRAIMACRTPALGGHREWCRRCGYERYLYHTPTSKGQPRFRPLPSFVATITQKTMGRLFQATLLGSAKTLGLPWPLYPSRGDLQSSYRLLR